MTGFRFLHSADLHLGRRFGALPEEVRGPLAEARHAALARLAQAARDHGAGHVLLAGDTFDSTTPSDRVWRQALAEMAAADDLHWWLLPGNHDSLAAEALWQRFRALAPATVHVIDTPAPIALAPGVTLLPAPLPRRAPGRDLTAWMEGAQTPPGTIRLGLAHGAVVDFAAPGEGGDATIPPDRAARAGLDFLALGDWHRAQAIGDRTWYAGTPERDSFRHAGPGVALAVTLPGPGAAPQVAPVPIGRFDWRAPDLTLTPETDAAAALTVALPAPGAARRDTLIRLRLTGRLRPDARAALSAALAQAAPEFMHLHADATALTTEHRIEDLDAITPGGALRQAAATLQAEATDPARSEAERSTAAAALDRLAGLLAEVDGDAP